MVAVTDAQAQKLWWVVKNGDWSLQLRPVTNAADSPDSVETSASLVADGLRSGARKRLMEENNDRRDTGTGPREDSRLHHR